LLLAISVALLLAIDVVVERLLDDVLSNLGSILPFHCMINERKEYKIELL